MTNPWWTAIWGGVVLVTLGCGKVTKNSDPIAAAGSGGAMSTIGASDSETVCPSLGLNPDAPLLVEGSGSDLWLVRADGELVALDHGFGEELEGGAPFEIRTVRIQGDYVLVGATVGNYYVPRFELALFSGEGRRLWHYGSKGVGDTVTSDLLFDDSGTVAFYESGVAAEGVVLSPDGSMRTTPGIVPLSIADADGWMAVREENELGSYGFLRLEDNEFVATRNLGRPDFAPPLAVMASSLLYLTLSNSAVTAVLEELNDANVNEAHLFEMPDVPIPGGMQRPFALHAGEHWAVVTNNGVPVLRIDLQTKQAFAVSGGNVQDPYFTVAAISADHFLFSDSSYVYWRLDAASGEFTTLDLGPTLRTLDAAYCTAPVGLNGDGRVAIPLRDDASGGMFLEQAASGEWQRIGLPFVDVASAGAQRYGESWLIRASDGENTYCPSGAWPLGEAPPGTLVGDSFQIVLPERGITRIMPMGFEELAAAHGSGLCLAFYEGHDLKLYDPVADTATVVWSASVDYNWLGTTTFF